MQLEITGTGPSRAITLSVQESGPEPSRLFAAMMEQVAAAAEGEGLTLADAVFHRLWTSSREVRDACANARALSFSGPTRTASSSFVSALRAPGRHAVAIDVTYLPGAASSGKRVVEFSPPRRYAHYAAAAGHLYLSGMAEEGATLDQQFARALEHVEAALRRESVGWQDARRVAMFVERGHGTLEHAKALFEAAVPNPVGQIRLEFVDGLASPGKNFEIEVVTALPG